jgi:hypothetical protein
MGQGCQEVWIAVSDYLDSEPNAAQRGVIEHLVASRRPCEFLVDSIRGHQELWPSGPVFDALSQIVSSDFSLLV